MQSSVTHVALAAALALSGCQSSDVSSADAGVDAALPMASVAAPTPQVEAVTGLKECDDLIAKYSICMSKDPDLARRDGLLFAARKSTLKIQATSTDGKDALMSRCKALFEARLHENCP